MSEIISGCCSICFEKINANNTGSRCKDCLRLFHISCCKTDSTRSLRSKEFTCNSCATAAKNQKQLSSVLNQLQALKDVPTTLEDMKTDLAAFKETTSQQITSLNTAQSKLTKAQDVISNRTSHLYKWDFRHDLIISGIPESIRNENILQLVIKTSAVFNQVITIKDIVFCSRMKSGGIIVKFVSIMLKDEIMRSYMKEKSLNLSQITDLEITSRVFLNHNYPQESQRIMVYCRKLKKSGLIKKFIINHNDGSAKIIQLNESEVNVPQIDDLVKLFPLVTDTGSGSDVHNATTR